MNSALHAHLVQFQSLTVVAVLILDAIDGSIWLQLQVKTLLAEQSCHNAFQLRLWKINTQPRPNPHFYQNSPQQIFSACEQKVVKKKYIILNTFLTSYPVMAVNVLVNGCVNKALHICSLRPH